MKIAEIINEMDYSDEQPGPLKAGDRIRVFHGFRDFHHAVEIAKHGTTGSTRASRIYSYEADNNPKGMFMTTSFKIAGEFVGGYGPSAIIEFMANIEDLEPPAWPSGSYTVQGGMAQYFGHDRKGRAARRQTQKRDEEDTRQRATKEPEFYSNVSDSDRAHLAFMLFHTREQQALFVGHLNPEDISAIHVRKEYRGPWVRLSIDEFLDQYGGEATTRDKMFKPRDEFDGDLFIARLQQAFNGDIDEVLAGAWETIKNSQYRGRTFISYFENYLWPKQYAAAIRWLKSRYT